MKRALDGSRPENAGFIRNGAYLAVIFLTDEDDCSPAATIAGTSTMGTSIFSLPSNQVGPGDFRCQPQYAYKCDSGQIAPTQTGTMACPPGGNGGNTCTPYTGCVPRVSTPQMVDQNAYLADPASYFSFLATVKDPSQIVIAEIIGTQQNGSSPIDPGTGKAAIVTGALNTPFQQANALQPSCQATINGNSAIARPGIRLASFLGNFSAERGRMYTICQGDYSAALKDIGNTLFNAISPCLEGNIDTTAAFPAPGSQPDCTVSDVQNANTAGQTEQIIPPCTLSTAPTVAACTNDACVAAGSTKPCWYVVSNPTACAGTPTGLELHVARTSPPPAGDTVEVACATKPM